uniref:SAM domain-containing protein n=1 Tax=Gasterosteus aculeatus aculeatus TaxID=481459 RepID=A0AAQ4QCY4_GASAC
MMSDASDMLAAALEQMDGIIAGSKAMDYSNGLFDCQSPTSPFLGGLRVLHLLEDLRGVLELMDNEERDNLRCQIPDSTAEGLAEWLQGRLTNGHGSDGVYQERLSRLESDKEYLFLSVLTDQVEVQGEKIRDLDSCLDLHRQKLNATEELLQQELSNRTALETQKLELISEVSTLKLQLTAAERDRRDNEGLYQEVTDLRFRVTDIENERLQSEKKLSASKVRQPALFFLACLRDPPITPRDPSAPFLLRLFFLTSVCDTLTRQAAQWFNGAATSFFSPQVNTKAGPASSSPPRASEGSFGTKKGRASFGRGFFKLRGGKQAASSPNLADAERSATEHLDLAGVPPRQSRGGSLLPSSPETKKKSKGFRRFFGRLKRSHSSSFNLDDEAQTEFRRGGVRATAGPRLAGPRVLRGSGAQGVSCPLTLALCLPHQELCMKHPLHRKKLQLALQALGSEEEDLKGRLDHNWVTRWLDDIGLPQYKSPFDEARVDGCMLHYMTVDDLLSLKVGSVLHHLSIKRAIQVLRLNCYEPNCLRRRPSDENNMTPAEISQWTNHRVMEWLRSVDLAEYAPNLRGSGVHGGLMVLEPRFNVEALALLLNIPPNKTLLRRHLATHFHLLVGSEAQRLKQECLENPDYVVLSATAKVKPRRLSFGGFGTLRKKRPEDAAEYVCPMNVEMPRSSSFQTGVRMYEEHLEHLEQMEDSEGTVRQIGEFSEEINNLTSMLKDDESFHEISVDAAGSDNVFD